MEDKGNSLPRGFIYREYDSTSRGSLYYVIRGIEKVGGQEFYDILVSSKFADKITSTLQVSLRNKIALLKLEGENRAQGRYPENNHAVPDTPFLLSSQELKEFVRFHPKMLRQLKEKTGIEELFISQTF